MIECEECGKAFQYQKLAYNDEQTDELAIKMHFPSPYGLEQAKRV